MSTAPRTDALRVLIVDDNRELVALLFDYLEPLGHALDAAPDGLTGLQLATTGGYDVIVLDWMLPRLNGPEVLTRLRENGCTTPVLMLTAKDAIPDKVIGFGAGADDYLTKPFNLTELELRLRALSIRTGGQARAQVLRVGELKYDLATLDVTRQDKPLQLYPAGRRLLEVLMQASPAAVTRERLERALWGDDPPDGDMLRSHIYELRRSIDGGWPTKLLHTLPRIGYRLAESAADDAGAVRDE